LNNGEKWHKRFVLVVLGFMVFPCFSDKILETFLYEVREVALFAKVEVISK
jgi:hypothetical protein